MNIVKVYYLNTLKDAGKIASQVAHCVLGLKLNYHPDKIIVLKASATKLSIFEDTADYKQYDLGYTEVEQGTLTAVAFEGCQ